MIDKILQTVASLSAPETALAVATLALFGFFLNKGWNKFLHSTAKLGAQEAMDRFAVHLSFAERATRLRTASKNVLIKLFALKRHFKRSEEQLDTFHRDGANTHQWRDLKRDASTRADQARTLARQARDEREWAQLASEAKKKAESALALLTPADRQMINTAPLHAALAEARKHFNAGDFEQCYNCAHPIIKKVEYAVEEVRLSKRFACFSEDTVSSRDRCIYTTAQTHLEKARALIKGANTLDKARTQLTCARIKIEYLEENSKRTKK